MTDINTLQDAVIANLNALAGVSSEAYSGQFDAEGAKKVLIKTPTILVAFLEGDVQTDTGTDQVYVVANWGAFCITRSVNELKKRNLEGQVLAQAVSQRLAFNRFGLLGVGIPEKIKIKPLNSQYFMANGLSVIAVYWQQSVRAGKSVWQGASEIFPIDAVYSHVPDVGFGHEADYMPLHTMGS
ncbi:MAG: hypothetical protein P1P78_11345 [Methyloprofundus sp.]|nr:hypothetical protein [Methyloprofundus sp.]